LHIVRCPASHPRPPLPTRRSSDLKTTLFAAASALVLGAVSARDGADEYARHDHADAGEEEAGSEAEGPGKEKTHGEKEGGCEEADRKSTRLNSSHEWSSYAVFCSK